jgi:two-component system response regulator TctD
VVLGKILIVENDLDLNDLLLQAFAGGGFRALVAPTVESAMYQLALSQPDLVILDLSLPGMDVWQTLQRIRELSAVPIIALSTSDEMGAVVGALDVGADDVVIKPFDVRELEARARALLRRAQRVAWPPSRLHPPVPNAEGGSVDALQRRNA